LGSFLIFLVLALVTKDSSNKTTMVSPGGKPMGPKIVSAPSNCGPGISCHF